MWLGQDSLPQYVYTRYLQQHCTRHSRVLHWVSDWHGLSQDVSGDNQPCWVTLQSRVPYYEGDTAHSDWPRMSTAGGTLPHLRTKTMRHFNAVCAQIRCKNDRVGFGETLELWYKRSEGQDLTVIPYMWTMIESKIMRRGWSNRSYQNKNGAPKTWQDIHKMSSSELNALLSFYARV